MASEESVFSRSFDYADRTKLTDSVYEELKAAIEDLRLRPGAMLRESTIGRQLGVSKTPVREALLKLEQDGLVELVPFKGARVSGYDAEDIREIFELRTLLEGECTRYAAENSQLVEALARSVADSKSALAAGDESRVIELLDEFDAMLFACMQNRRVQNLIENLEVHMKRIGKLTTEIPGRVEASIQQHGRIVLALRRGDADQAQREMRAHIGSVLADELAHIQAKDVDAEAVDAGPGSLLSSMSDDG